MDNLNSDSYPDLIVPCNGTNRIQIFYGTASGVYSNTPDVTLIGNFNSQKAIVADFNNDGRKDLAIVYYYDGVQIWLQDLSGQFTLNNTLSVDGQFSRCLVAGDLNGDAWTDLAIVSEQEFSFPYLGRVTLWMGSPTGFTSGGSYTTGGQISDWIAMADMNEDGRNDVVTSNDDPSNTVSVLLNTGLSSPRLSSPTQYSVGPGPNTCTAVDLNGDGHIDVATADWSGVASYSVLLGVGNGTLQPAMTTFPSSLQESDAFAIAAGEMTGDARIDLVITGGVMGTVSVLPGNGNGTFGPARLYGTGSAARGVALGDVNGDGRTDIVTTNLNSNTVQVLTATPSRKFPGAVFAIGTDSPSSFNINDRLVGNVAAGDINRDGRVDLATIHPAAGTASIVFGAGDGTFGPPSNLAVGPNPQTVQLADLDQDGNLDLVTVLEGNGTVSVQLGKGDGTFKAKNGYGVGKSPRYVMAADVNGDGRPDLITADYDDNAVSVLLKTSGGGGFKSRAKFAAGSGPTWVAAGDLNRDGFVDLVVADQLSGGFSVLYGTGNNALFGAPVFTGTGGGPLSVAAADLNLDGTPEIMVSNTPFNRVEVWRSSGPTAYSLDSYFITVFEPREVTVGDLDRDGYPEILAAARLGQSFALYYGSAAPVGISRRWAFGSMGTSVVMADANGDGWPDLVTLNPRCQAVSVLLNQLGGASLVAAGRSHATSGGALGAVLLSPNPINPVGTLRFSVTRAGPLRVNLFDVQGRLVKTILDETLAPAGDRSVLIDGRGQKGASLGSGIYFYRIESRAGVVTGRFAILK